MHETRLHIKTRDGVSKEYPARVMESLFRAIGKEGQYFRVGVPGVHGANCKFYYYGELIMKLPLEFNEVRC